MIQAREGGSELQELLGGDGGEADAGGSASEALSESTDGEDMDDPSRGRGAGGSALPRGAEIRVAVHARVLRGL